ncbi:MAG: DUF3299 domain-containing protein, partial [Alphaproteobacteria bacterium]
RCIGRGARGPPGGGEAPQPVSPHTHPPPPAERAGGARTGSAQPETEKAEILNWNDLLPEGEVQRIQELYDQYFKDLERRMQGSGSGGMGPLASIAEGSAADTMPQLGTFNVVKDLDGKTIRIPGYVVPLTAVEGNEYKEFLLVPYFGACIHTPPPPPNQILYVKADPAVAIEALWEPFWVQGVMQTQSHYNETGDAAYTVLLTKLEPYGR